MKKVFSKLISRKFWGGLVLVNLLISGLQVPKVLAQNPVWNSFSGEQEFLKVGYQSADGKNIIDYADQVTAPAEAKAGDLIKARIYFHNGNPGTIATNAIAKLTGVSGEGSKFTPSANLSADFTETVTDTAEINLPKSFKLEYVAGSTKKWTLSDPVNGPDKFDKIVSLSDGITTDSGVNFGDPKINGIEGCWEFRGFITLWLKLTELSPPTGSVVIKKTVVDKNDNPLTDPNDLKGFEFKIKGKGIDQTVVTDEKGEAKFANLPIGPYEVNETPRIGYEIISTMPVLVNISNANLNWELKIKNKKSEEPQPVKGSVKIVKILLDETGKEIAKPNDLYKNWQIVLTGAGFEKTALTDEKGEVSFLNLNLGPYEVNQAPKTDWTTQIKLPILVNLSEQNPNAIVTITDKAKEQPVFGSIKVKKILLDENGREVTRPSEKLAGFEFKISGKDGFTKAAVTANDGLVSFNDLMIGNYEISETARSGYRIKTSLPILVVLSKANPNQEVSVTNEIIPAPPVKGQITVEKRLLNDKGELIAVGDAKYRNWTIRLFGKNRFNQNLVTGVDGKVVFSNLELGQYTVNQVGKDGWITQIQLPITVNLTNDNPTVQVAIEDKLKPVITPEQKGLIRIVKTVKGLADKSGFEFKLDGPNGLTLTQQTGPGGRTEFKNLPLGKYTLTETPRDGYKIITKMPIALELTKNLPGVQIGVENEKMVTPPETLGKVRVIVNLLDEKDKQIKKPDDVYKGWEIVLKGTNFEKTLKTDDRGMVDFTDLKLGNYTVNEALKDGWQKLTALPMSINLTKTNNSYVVNITNGKISGPTPELKGLIRVVKSLRNEKGQLINAPSSRLAGFEFEITGPNGFSQIAITNNQGRVEFKDLTLGKYDLNEKTREGYEIVTKMPVKLELTKNLSGIQTGVENKVTVPVIEPKGTIRINKIVRNSTQLNGFEFNLSGPNGLTLTQATGPGGRTEFKNLPLGKYTLTETPRDGYKIITKMPIALELTKNLPGVQIGVENEKIIEPVLTSNLQIKKYVSSDEGKTWFNKDQDDRTLMAKPGDKLSYKIVVWNTGNADAQNVKIIDTILNEQFYQSIEKPNMIIDLVGAKDNKTEVTGKVITYKAVLKNGFPEWETILDNLAYIDNDDVSKSSVARVSVFVMPVISPLIIERTVAKEVIRKIDTGGAPAIFTEKTVRNLTRGDKDYNNQINAGSGDEIEYRVYFRNNTEFEAIDIGLRDVLPAGLTLISGSARLSRGGTESALGDFVNGWINSLGNYQTNQEAFVTFKAKLAADLKEGSVLVNTAYIAPRGFGISSDTALINIARAEEKPAAPAAPTKTAKKEITKGKELPKAGANTFLLSLTSLIGSILGFAGTRLRDEKRFLKEMSLSYKMR